MQSNRQFWVLGHKVTSIETVGNYALLEVAAIPGIPGPPPHFHKDAPELFHIVSGSLEVLCNSVWRRLESGESFLVPRGEIHTFRNNLSEEARFMTTWSPRGFEGFFFEFGVPVGEDNAFERSLAPELLQRAVSGCGKYGMVLAGSS